MHLLIPSTFGLNERDDKLRVMRYGTIARAAAIFGVDHVHIYRDEDRGDETGNAERMEKYLAYAECPPYLRKQLIPHDPDLQYANIMPALQIVSHGYSEQFREAAVVEQGDEWSVLDAGLDEHVELPEELPVDARVTLMQDDEDWQVIDPESVDGFWTYRVHNHRDPLGPVIDALGAPVIGTSVDGDPVEQFAASPHADRPDLGIAFGSAWRGLHDLMERGDVTEDAFTGIYNTVPGQHTETVRTDEAIMITLGVLNAF